MGLGLAQLSAQMQNHRNQVLAASKAAEAALDAALTQLAQLAEEQGKVLQGLADIAQSSQAVAEGGLAAAAQSMALEGHLETIMEKQAAMQAQLRAAVEGAGALVDLADMLAVDAEAEAALQPVENAALAAHWHML